MPDELFDVVLRQTGERVVLGVDEETARSERARLADEARTINPDTRKPTSMVRGRVAQYEVVSQGGVVL